MESLIVPVNAGEIVVRNTPDGVHVVPRMQVTAWLQGRDEVLPAATVQSLYDAARRSTTWTT